MILHSEPENAYRDVFNIRVNKFDVMDRLTNIVWKNSASNVLRSFAYQFNDASMITNIALEDGARLSYAYDNLDRLISESRSGDGQYAINYSWDEVGNRLARTNGGTTVSYAYSNGNNRLLGWTATSTNNFADILKSELSGSSSENIGTNVNLGRLYVSNSLTGSFAAPSISASNFSLSTFSLSLGTQQLIAAIGDAAGNALVSVL